MSYVLEIILGVIMFLLSLFIVFVGIVVWWCAGAFLYKLIVSIFIMLAGLAMICLSAMFILGLF